MNLLQREAARASAKVRWTAPCAAIEDARRHTRYHYLNMAVRSCALTAVSLFVLRNIFERSTRELPWDYFLWIGSLFPLLSFLPTVLALSLRRSARPAEYAIIADGILIPSHEHPLMRWTWLDSYTLEPHDSLDGLTVLCAYRKDGTARPFILPADGTTAALVEREFASRLPRRPPLPKHSPTRPRDFVIALALFIPYTIVAAALIDHFRPTLRGHGQELELLLLILGPGTVLAPLLWRRRAGNAIFSLAAMMNLIGAMAAMTTAALRHIMIALPPHP